MKILSTHRLFYLLHRYETAINDAPYMPELYEKAEEFRIAIEREVVDEAMQADAARYRHMRASAAFQNRNGPGLYWYLPRWDHNLPSGESLDNAIDAAMALDKS